MAVASDRAAMAKFPSLLTVVFTSTALRPLRRRAAIGHPTATTRVEDGFFPEYPSLNTGS